MHRFWVKGREHCMTVLRDVYKLVGIVPLRVELNKFMSALEEADGLDTVDATLEKIHSIIRDLKNAGFILEEVQRALSTEKDYIKNGKFHFTDRDYEGD